jgi:peptidoglycan/LPS O-acetylase OafA/YrhL
LTIVDGLIRRSPESAPLAIDERAAARSIAVPTYRADIDGLRAVAVLLVVGFHAFPATVTGGFIGVDIFFVISGFLITGIILREREAGRFSYRTFYARRIKRIFPALIFVLIAVLIGGWFLLPPLEYTSLGKNAAAGAGFSANFTLLSEAGYFDIAADRKPLLHLWSLGIEEQFYIVWPALLILLTRTRRSLLVAIGAIVVASFGIGFWRLRVDPGGAFYLPDGRAWELLVGAMLAVGGQSLRLPRWLHDFGAVIGCALIGVAVATLKTGSSFPGLWAVPPVVWGCASNLLRAVVD